MTQQLNDLRAREVKQRITWLEGKSDKKPHGVSTEMCDGIDDAGYFLPIQLWMLDSDAYYSGNW